MQQPFFYKQDNYLVPYRSRSGSLITLDIAETCNDLGFPFGLESGQIVSTPEGFGVVLGVTSNKLQFHVSGHTGIILFLNNDNDDLGASYWKDFFEITDSFAIANSFELPEVDPNFEVMTITIS